MMATTQKPRCTIVCDSECIYFVMRHIICCFFMREFMVNKIGLFVVFTVLLFNSIVPLNAQSSSGKRVNERIISQLIFTEWEDGCLTSVGFNHYSPIGIDPIRVRHENNNANVNNARNNFYNDVKRFNAISSDNLRATVDRSQVGDRFYVYAITTTSGRDQGFYDIGNQTAVEGGGIIGSPGGYIYPPQNYTTYNYTLKRVDVLDGTTATTSSSSGSSTSSYLWGGYNYANGLPLGVTVGYNFIYFSVNIGGRDDSFGLEAEWIAGLSIPLIDFLWIPIGIGANHSGPDDEMVHRFVMEIGLQPVIFNFLYLSATYRLIGLKQSGFTIGAGFIFR